MGVYETDDRSFDEDVLRAPLPVLVDFWAKWCGPCRTLGPVVDRIANAYDGRLIVVKVDVDASPQLRRRFVVQSVPRLVLFKGGREVGALLGAHPQPRIEELINRHVGPAPSLPAAEPEPTPEAFGGTPDYAPPDRFPTPMLDEPSPLDAIIQPAGRRR